LRILIRLALLGLFAAAVPAAPAIAQGTEQEQSPQVRELLRILDDPQVRSWLKSHTAADTPAAAAVEPAAGSPSEYLAGRIARVHGHITDLAAAWPTLPAQFAAASATLSNALAASGSGQVLLLIGFSVLIGAAAEALVRTAFSGLMRWTAARPLETTGQRLWMAGLRLVYGMALVLAFAIGSFGLFAASDWEPLLREIVVGYLFVFILARAVLALCHFFTAPGDARFRLLPIDGETGRFWSRRIALMVGWFAFGWVTVTLLSRLGFTTPGRQVVAYLLGLVLLGLALEAVWRRPEHGPDGAAVAPPRRRRVMSLVISFYLLLIWALWAAGMVQIFWLVVAAAALPAAIRISDATVAALAQPAGNALAQPQATAAYRVLAERSARALLIIAAALLLARAWGLDLTNLAESETLATRLLRGAVSAVVVMLMADIAWRVIRAVIDHQLGQPAAGAEAAKRTRLRTLLPILRNVLFVVIFTMAGLMVLSAMGVQIGPLLAGAGVAGVAIGFGAQTLVKDIISGVFYLLDDAFRVGEYIQSGSYKGTVESFSLRSVKLRHHRGPLYTVPFGELGAVQNMSRDWVIDKMMVTITYDSDLAKAKKLIKQIGKDLAAEPDFAKSIIEPLKMQGVEAFGEYGMTIRMKMMTKPSEQFTIRRRALALIKVAFDANGIGFASPTVKVAEGTSVAAAAQQAVTLAKPAAPPA
jgi:small-conductance mechanosensitive channel